MANFPLALAPGACLSCRQQKQRCDRVIPSCSRCVARVVKCTYPARDQAALRQIASVSQFAADTLVILRGLCPLDVSPAGERALLWAACARQSTFVDDEDAPQASLSCIINDVFDSAGVHVVGTVIGYFDIAHHWLPILDRDNVLASTENFVAQKGVSAVEDDAFALMIVCMYLFITPPCQHANHPVRHTLYRTVKSLFSVLQASSDTTARVLLMQSGIILATHEIGHGMSKDAYETLIACRSLLQRINLHDHITNLAGQTGRHVSLHRLQLDLCLSAIILLDMTVVLSTIDHDLPQLVHPSQVPQDSLLHRASNDDIYGEDAVRNLFARAQHALRLGDMSRSIGSSTDLAQCEAIEKTIYGQIGSYISKTQGGRFPLCETVAMSLSTLMVLYRKTNYLTSAVGDAKSNMAATCAYNLIIDTCRVESELLQRHGWHNSRRPCFLGLCCLLAASVHLDKLCPNGLEDGDAQQLRQALTGFSSRWKLGDVLLRQLGNGDGNGFEERASLSGP
ncbi:Zn(2)-C6 fungal-type DNA-binding domain protein [Metarhizium brunneum]